MRIDLDRGLFSAESGWRHPIDYEASAPYLSLSIHHQMAINSALNSLAVAAPAVAVAGSAETAVGVVDSAADVAVEDVAAWAAAGTESEILVVPITDVSYRDYLHLVSFRSICWRI